MNEPTVAALYGGVKLLAYSAYCFYGLKLADRGARDGRRATIPRALGLGVLRWVIGLVLGIFLYFAFATSAEKVWTQYVAVYVPVRILEWGFMALLVGIGPPRRRVALWIAGGILISFATDLTSPEMFLHGRFCVGRCLC